MDRLNQLLDQYKIALGLSLVGVVLIIGGIYSSGLTSATSSVKSPTTKTTTYPSQSKVSVAELTSVKELKVDVSGSVETPGVYSITEGGRVEDAIKAAGGITTDANLDYVNKTLNLSQKLTDGTKIYIPNKSESIVSNPSLPSNLSTSTSVTNGKVSINNASQAELEDLPSIGPVTASKIIKNRPYDTVDDLLTKKSVSKSVLAKIRDLVDL